jgi:uncharacterized membrane protein
MRLSLFLVWRSTSTFNENTRSRKIVAFIAFATQLILNVLWSFIFFGLRPSQIAFVEIIILLMSIAVTIVDMGMEGSTPSDMMRSMAGSQTGSAVINSGWQSGSSISIILEGDGSAHEASDIHVMVFPHLT